MQFTLRALTRQDIKAIHTWRYPNPYARYNGDTLTFDMRLFLFFRAIFSNPPYEYFAVENEHGELVGLFQFMRRPQNTILIGLGMRPDLTGQGHGLAFVEAGLAFARQRYAPKTFRLNVFASNPRAEKVYTRAGFEVVRKFSRFTFRGLETVHEMKREEA
ncbi:MAG TPA: GNAT family protein [Ktedonobacteraceae bacterium]|jgi:ribosomal-protein-alanine N-acetyltransferase|nr:GNAT family protein [Ktedonobacteraceae bacterium]